MKKILIVLTVFTLALFTNKAKSSASQTLTHITDTLPIRGFEIAAPRPSGVDSFVTFIKKELIPRHVNTLVLRVDYAYQFKSHLELIDSFALSEKDVKKIVRACRQGDIKIIPQINLLGHQSWANRTGKLLSVYPQFDETPWVQMPVKYEWPNADNLYCKSYCPLYPGIHKIIFDLIDEICDVFETNAFHAGMDEVFYIGERKCPRCGGHDPAQLFADEVRRIDNHLAESGKQLWIWGDRLLDGKTTGLGEWEASMNNTYRAIDMIPKDVIICDWHYERADQTAVYFAMKGLKVISCPFRNADAGEEQVEDMYKFRQRSTPEMKERFQGIMQTIWTRNDLFLKEYYGQGSGNAGDKNTSSNCFKRVFSVINP
ncbi:MAG TPA: family 20 glycosylhydrolase [Hanamia sp.]|nr:family 20 glycosylhydrolase [Hanamia sp.]